MPLTLGKSANTAFGYRRGRYNRGRRSYRKYKKTNYVRKPLTVSTYYKGPQPSQRVVHMRYCAYKNMNPEAGGTCAVYNFRANGIYDPDCAAGGQQPLGRDQWATFFDHYVVLGARCVVNFQGKSDAPNYVPNVCGILLNDDETLTATTWVDVAEQGRCKYITVQGSGTSATPHTVVMGYSPYKQYRVSNPQLMDSITASVGSDPTDQTIFSIFCGAVNQTEDTTGVHATITIDYIVKFYEPTEIARS